MFTVKEGVIEGLEYKEKFKNISCLRLSQPTRHYLLSFVLFKNISCLRLRIIGFGCTEIVQI